MNPAVQFLDTLMKNADKLFKDYISLEELKQNGGISLKNYVIQSNQSQINLIDKVNNVSQPTDSISINQIDEYEITLRAQDPLEMYDSLLNKKRALKKDSSEVPVITNSKPKKKPVKNKKTPASSLYLEFE